MQTTIKQVGPVEYELDIKATAEDLAPEFKKALRAEYGKVFWAKVKHRRGLLREIIWELTMLENLYATTDA